jgi:hypothetical protein
MPSLLPRVLCGRSQQKHVSNNCFSNLHLRCAFANILLIFLNLYSFFVDIIFVDVRFGVSKSVKTRLVFISSPLRRQHIGERANTGWFGISIMFSGGMTFLPEC